MLPALLQLQVVALGRVLTTCHPQYASCLCPRGMSMPCTCLRHSSNAVEPVSSVQRGGCAHSVY